MVTALLRRLERRPRLVLGSSRRVAGLTTVKELQVVVGGAQGYTTILDLQKLALGREAAHFPACAMSLLYTER